MNEREFWHNAALLNTTQPIFLFIVVDHKGSSPGKTGFKMVITGDKQIGTVGGGIMEANLIKDARASLPEGSSNTMIRQIHRSNVDPGTQSGLICAGEQTILRSYLPIASPLMSELQKATEKGMPIGLSASPYQLTTDNFNDVHRFRLNYYDQSRWEYREQLGTPPSVYLFGAGHVGYAIAKALEPLDFIIRLHDHRESTELRFDTAFVDDRLTGNYSEMASNVPEGNNIYVVITTSSYPTDIEVLREIIEKDIKYVGLMGSKAKIAKIFQELKDDGISTDLLDKVYAPIGLQIPNESAEEIAVSVVAQLIATKNAP